MSQRLRDIGKLALSAVKNWTEINILCGDAVPIDRMLHAGISGLDRWFIAPLEGENVKGEGT